MGANASMSNTAIMAADAGKPNEATQSQTDGSIRLVGILAGVGSGLTKVAVGHGFDTIKTRMQCNPGVYKGALDTLKQTIKNEGILALYKGATPPAVGWAAIDSILIGSLHNYRLFLMRYGFTEPTPIRVSGINANTIPDGGNSNGGERRLTLTAHGIAGLFAGWTSALAATPMELLKVKLQLQRERAASDRQFKGPLDCARQIVRTQGVSGLWTGFIGSLAFRSNFLFMFASFEVFMRAFSTLDGTRYQMSTGTANFLSGGFGAFSFWFAAMPADNIKNRMMAKPLPNSGSAEPYVRPTFMSVAREIHTREGLPGFYRGLTPTLLRAFPVNAAAFFVFEWIMRSLGAEKTR